MNTGLFALADAEALAWARKSAVDCRASGEVREILFRPATQEPGGSA